MADITKLDPHITRKPGEPKEQAIKRILSQPDPDRGDQRKGRTPSVEHMRDWIKRQERFKRKPIVLSKPANESLLLTFSQFLTEMPALLKDYDKSSNRMYPNPTDDPDKYGRVISRHGHHEIRRNTYHDDWEGGQVTKYTAFNTKHRVADIQVAGVKQGKHFTVSRLKGREGTEIKAHELYHHLTTKHGIVLHSDSTQSVGGLKVWKEMSKKPGLKMKHTFNDKELPLHKDADWDKNYRPDSAAHVKDPEWQSHFTIARPRKWFRRKIQEAVVRNNARAKKLVDYMQKREGKRVGDHKYDLIKNLVPHVDRNPRLNKGYSYEYHGIEDIPVHKIRSNQSVVFSKAVKQKIDNKGPHSSDYPNAYHHHDGYYYLNDGNHRSGAARITGDKTITAHVFRPVH
jgi:hypothetical protein